MPKWERFSIPTVMALASVMALSACGSNVESRALQPEGNGSVRVTAAFYPLSQIARAVGGEHVSVTTLVPPGSEAHEYELTSRQLERAQKSNLVIFLGDGFQPAVEKLVRGVPADVRTTDLLTGLRLWSVTQQLDGVDGTTAGEVLDGDMDPHVWLDPDNMARMAERVAKELAAVDPSHTADYEANLRTYVARLQGLADKMRTGLADCDSRVVVTSHRAFEYLARRFALRQIPIAGITPDTEPSAKTMEAVAKLAKAEHVGTIFFEESQSASLSKTLASEIGVKTAALNPIETLSEEQLDAGADYVSEQEKNLAALRKGLGCR